MIKPTEAKEKLLSMLQEAGYDKKRQDIELILNVFRAFSKIKVDCSNDAFLFQCGTYSFTGEKLFYWDIVRQFEVVVDNEYDHIEQLHFEVTFTPNDELSRGYLS